MNLQNYFLGLVSSNIAYPNIDNGYTILISPAFSIILAIIAI